MKSLLRSIVLFFLPLTSMAADLATVMGAVADDPGEVAALMAGAEQRGLNLTRELGEPDLSRAYQHNVIANLEAKAALEPPLTLSAEVLERTVLDYEAFKLRSYLTSGVFPKRYFGYFDLRHDTEDAEWILRETTHCAVDVINAYQAKHDKPIRIDDAEVAVTFISEGGAILLREDQDKMNALDPIMDVGLDDIAKGQLDYLGLVDWLDRDCGTNLIGLVEYTPVGAAPPKGAISRGDASNRVEQWSWFMRKMTFKEGIVATAFMWLWEKEIAERKLVARGDPPLHTRDRTDQFIIGSLVYNSGIVHSNTTHARIRAFATGDYLYERSEANAKRRPRLNLLPPRDLRPELAETLSYRPQWTSWVAVYHIMQRYGGWKALHLHADIFDQQGRFLPRERSPQ